MRTCSIPAVRVCPGDVIVTARNSYEVDEVERFADTTIVHANEFQSALFYRPDETVDVMIRPSESVGEYLLLACIIATAILAVLGVL